jgi:hypothetical protein
MQMTELTDGFSFAYLKELFLSSMMRCLAMPQPGAMDEVMVEQVAVLRDQMVSATMAPVPKIGSSGEDGGPPPHWRRMMRDRVIYGEGPSVW